MNRITSLRPIQRWRQLGRIVEAEGWRGVRQRAQKSVSEWIAPSVPVMSVRNTDVVAADLARPNQPAAPSLAPGEAITINWVTVPAGPGAGGHTTLFRIINYLQAHGYRNRVYFYDINYVDHEYYSAILRNHYKFTGEISSIDAGMLDAHAIVATSWPTAYPVFNTFSAGRRYFFVQDFEPYFYAAGAANVLAENTYRMGFHAITAGRWLAHKLSTEFGMHADYFEFGCDAGRYRCNGGDQIRSSISYYARPEVARRGFELGIMALEIFARRCPDIKINLYGDRIDRLPFEFVNHGRVNPDQLNQIYNQCYAGLSISLTNVSLVPHEMLAAGCIPIVNDAPQNRIVLNNPYIKYAELNPHALAAALESIVTMNEFESYSQAAARSVGVMSWDGAGTTVDSIFRRTLRN